MNYEESSQKIREQLASYSQTNAEDWHLCLKARFGMAVVFNALRDIKGYSKVITTSYTCITAVNPILVAGLRPIYADITPDYLSPTKIPDILADSKTSAIVMQHTLGIIGNKSSIKKYADKHHLVLIEDSAHCVTRLARDKDNNIIADISVHSFGVEKILTGSKFGGAIYVNPELKQKEPELYDRIIEKLKKLPKPSKTMGFRLRTYRYNNALLQRLPDKIKRGVRNAEIKTGILEPAIYPFEQDGQQDEPQTTNNYINTRIISQLETLPANFVRRNANVDLYHTKLKSKFIEKITRCHEPLLAYPILFKDTAKANEAYDLLSSNGYFVRRWYSPLLYPGPNNTKIYRYDKKSTPLAEDISKRILCLPTDLPVIETNKIIELLSTQKAPVQKPVENTK